MFGVVVGLAIAHASRWSAPRLADALDDVRMPAGFTVVDEQRQGGPCLDECTWVQRTWVMEGSVDEAQATVGAVFAGAGYALASWMPAHIKIGPLADGVEADGHWARHRVRLSIGTTRRPAIARPHPVPAPPGHVFVTALLDG